MRKRETVMSVLQDTGNGLAVRLVCSRDTVKGWASEPLQTNTHHCCSMLDEVYILQEYIMVQGRRLGHALEVLHKQSYKVDTVIKSLNESCFHFTVNVPI